MASQSAWLQGSRSQPVTCLCVCVCFRCVWHCLPLIAEENTPWGKTLPLSSLWTEIQPRDRNLLSKEPSCRWHLNLYVHKGSSTQKISEYLGGNKIFFQRISIELLSLGSSRQIYWSGLPFHYVNLVNFLNWIEFSFTLLYYNDCSLLFYPCCWFFKNYW